VHRERLLPQNVEKWGGRLQDRRRRRIAALLRPVLLLFAKGKGWRREAARVGFADPPVDVLCYHGEAIMQESEIFLGAFYCPVGYHRTKRNEKEIRGSYGTFDFAETYSLVEGRFIGFTVSSRLTVKTTFNCHTCTTIQQKDAQLQVATFFFVCSCLSIYFLHRCMFHLS
jgi:hypothetical protein